MAYSLIVTKVARKTEKSHFTQLQTANHLNKQRNRKIWWKFNGNFDFFPLGMVLQPWLLHAHQVPVTRAIFSVCKNYDLLRIPVCHKKCLFLFYSLILLRCLTHPTTEEMSQGSSIYHWTVKFNFFSMLIWPVKCNKKKIHKPAENVLSNVLINVFLNGQGAV